MKKKKIPNKIRRRIMRTTSALTMAMAVAVAAMPVENLGTTQAAANTDFEYSTLSSKHATFENGLSDIYKADTYEKYGSGNTETVQRITTSGTDIVIQDYFKVQVDGSGTSTKGYITAYLLDNGKDIVINETEVYGYIKMDNTYFNEFNTAMQNETYTFTYDTTSASRSGPNESDTPISVATISESAPTVTFSNGVSSVDFVNNYDYNNISGLDSTLQNSISDKLLSVYASELSAYVDDYNKAVNDAVTAANSSDKWTALASKFDSNGLVNTSATDAITVSSDITINNKKISITKTYAEIMSELSQDAKIDFRNFMICQRVYSSTYPKYNLKDYTLKNLSGGIYVPKLSDEPGATGVTGQVRDDDGYLASGKVSIIGIASGAFKDKNMISGSITLPGTLQFIGSDAFSGQGMSEVIIDNTKNADLVIIGDRAFENCSPLQSFTFKKTTGLTKRLTIGNKAFKKAFARPTENSPDRSIILPDNTYIIGGCCFDSSNITSVDFKEGTQSDGLTIEGYAFYDCLYLNSVQWDDIDNENVDMEINSIGEGAFSIGNSADYAQDVLTLFTFPTLNADDREMKKDYILAGRSMLEKVNMPRGIKSGTSIPDNTLAGCIRLEELYFPDSSGGVTYTADLFKNMNSAETGLHVSGPMNYPSQSGNQAKTRTTTWAITDGKGNAVPYTYINENGVECWEYGIIEDGDAKFIASISFPDGTDKPGTLEGFTINTTVVNGGKLSEKRYLEIGKIANKTIGQIGGSSGCIFPEGMKEWIYEVVIDEGVTTIAPDAFKGSNVEWVYLPSTLTRIGSGAFSGCNYLENVTFNWNDEMYDAAPDDPVWSIYSAGGDTDDYGEGIALDAFNTGSDYLTFHGAVSTNYAPFKYAMKKDAYEKTSISLNKVTEICYVMDSPYNLTIIRDDSTTTENGGLATLVDYTHYEELDNVTNFIKILKNNSSNSSSTTPDESNETETTTTDTTTSALEVLSDDIPVPLTDTLDPTDTQDENLDVSDVENTIYVNIPYGVESIDTVSYFNDSKNDKNSVYLKLVYEDKEGDSKINTGVTSEGEKVINRSEDKDRSKINAQTTSTSKYNNVQRLYSDSEYDPRTTTEKENGGLLVPGLYRMTRACLV
jgi:hypothetical protein